MKCVSFRHLRVESCFFTQSGYLCFLIEVFDPFAFTVIIDMVGYKSTISYLFSFCPFWVFWALSVSLLSCAYLFIYILPSFGLTSIFKYSFVFHL